MRALVTGADGMLGSALLPLLEKDGYETFPTDIVLLNPKTQHLDIRDQDKIKSYVNMVSPQIIFHLAAETNVDKCELENKHAYTTNALGTKNIALVCKENDIIMVYISTCGVFDGKKGAPYTELDIPNPISVYTRSKFEGEKVVEGLLKKYFIFRAGWMMGGGKKDKKFIVKIVELTKTKNILTVVDDKRGCPTFTKDFSAGIIKIVKLGRYGLFHLTNKGSATRYDIACKIVEYLGRDDIGVKPISSKDFPLPAPRPDSEVVDTQKIEQLNINMRPWEEALKEYLEELIEEK
ncbi:MAG: dTDP-4-dehydrorhamnose reductase [Candidatus Omnitrophica bacterium]|nr:dTDP-4-dehydrorhamnose reductase [Candidatus Omnitrophota bacterium]